MSKTSYTVSRDLGHVRTDGSRADGSGLWYVHMVGYPYIPVFGTFCVKRSDAVAIAKRMNAVI